MKVFAQLTKNTYKDEGICLKLDKSFNSVLPGGTEVAIEVPRTRGGPVIVTGRVFGDQRAIYIDAVNTKKARFPRIKKGGPTLYSSVTLIGVNDEF